MSLLVARRLRQLWDAGALSGGEYTERLLRFARPANFRSLLDTMPEPIQLDTIDYVLQMADASPSSRLVERMQALRTALPPSDNP